MLSISKPIDILDFENVLRDMNANSQLKYSEEFMVGLRVFNMINNNININIIFVYL